MNKPLHQMTLYELIAERDDYKIRYIDSATGWGAAYGVACKYVNAIEREMERRGDASESQSAEREREAFEIGDRVAFEGYVTSHEPMGPNGPQGWLLVQVGRTAVTINRADVRKAAPPSPDFAESCDVIETAGHLRSRAAMNDRQPKLRDPR